MQIFDSYKSSINQPLDVIEGHSIAIKREDLIHPIISGNKFRKLKYILKEVVDDNIPIVITFGGAFSNHLAATASAGKSLGIRTLGIVRGEEWKNKICLSSTLSFCQKQGMRLICVPRAIYAKKEAAYEIQKILKKYPRYRLIPEGGTEILSLKGCSEILQPEDFGLLQYWNWRHINGFNSGFTSKTASLRLQCFKKSFRKGFYLVSNKKN